MDALEYDLDGWGKSYQASASVAGGEHGLVSGRALGLRDERAVGGCVLADPEGLAAGVDGLEVEREGGAGGDGAEAEGSVVVAGVDWGGESQGEEGQEEGSGG